MGADLPIRETTTCAMNVPAPNMMKTNETDELVSHVIHNGTCKSQRTQGSGDNTNYATTVQTQLTLKANSSFI